MENLTNAEYSKEFMLKTVANVRAASPTLLDGKPDVASFDELTAAIEAADPEDLSQAVNNALVAAGPARKEGPEFPNVSESQTRAIWHIVEGASFSKAAAEAGVDRCTLYRWRQRDPAFKAALKWTQQSRLTEAQDRLKSLGERALNAVEDALQNNDRRLAMQVVKELRLLQGPEKPASRKPTDLMHQIAPLLAKIAAKERREQEEPHS